MFVQPMNALLKSRKFMVALAAVAAYVITLALPDLRSHSSEIASVLVWLAGLLIGGITLEDAGKAVSGGPPDLDTAIREIMTDVLDQLLTLRQQQSGQSSSLSDPPASKQLNL
jgi:CBS domain-containing protein